MNAPLNAATGYGERYCSRPEFRCLTVKRGDRWISLFPDRKQRDMVERLNRMNVRPRSGQQIAVPLDLDNVDYLDLAPLPRSIVPPNQNRIVVNQDRLAWGAYDTMGTLLNWGPISGGKSYCRDVKRACRTWPGRFTIYRMEDARCKSKKFPIGKGGAKMPYCMFYRGGFAIHGSHKVPGYHASHGCVRVFVDDARWLYEKFAQVNQTQVWIDQPETVETRNAEHSDAR